MRLFFAVEIGPDPALFGLYEGLSALGKGLRPVDPAKQHLTVKFIGDPPCPYEKVIEAASGVPPRNEPVLMRPLGFGAFPDWERPNVIWIGLEGTEGLSKMVSELEDALFRVAKVPRERKTFKPHITTARIKGAVGSDVDRIKGLHASALQRLEENGYCIEVTELVLFNSTLTPRGPIYERLSTFPVI